MVGEITVWKCATSLTNSLVYEVMLYTDELCYSDSGLSDILVMASDTLFFLGHIFSALHTMLYTCI